MSHTRATYPAGIADHYRQHGGKATCAAYQTAWRSLRRWLVEHGISVRPQGLRLEQSLRSAQEEHGA